MTGAEYDDHNARLKEAALLSIQQPSPWALARAEKACEIKASWETKGPVLLRDAHALLPSALIDGFIAADMLERYATPLRDCAGEYVFFEHRYGSWRDALVEHLRRAVLSYLNSGELHGTCLEPDSALRGKRIDIAAERWRVLSPNFAESTVSVSRSLVGIDVMVDVSGQKVVTLPRFKLRQQQYSDGRPPEKRQEIAKWMSVQGDSLAKLSDSKVAQIFIASLPLAERRNWSGDSVRKMVGAIRDGWTYSG